jgi:VanZ family protein
MVAAPGRTSWRPAFFRWLIWLAFVALWTQALLTPNPGQHLLATLRFLHLLEENPVEMQRFREHAFYFAKACHIGAYLVLAVLSGWLKVPGRYRWLLLVFMSLHAMGTEYGQNFVEGRHASWRDVGLDHAGFLAGIALSWKWWRGDQRR